MQSADRRADHSHGSCPTRKGPGLTVLFLLLQAYVSRIAAFDKAFTASLINSEHAIIPIVPAC